MQLRQGSKIIYSGRLLSESEIMAYEESYGNVTQVYSSSEAFIKRKAIYKAESDPLYMEWQFDQSPESEQAWRDKVEEIKLRYPLVEA